MKQEKSLELILKSNTYISLKTSEIKKLDTFMYKCNLNCRCKYINVRKNNSKNTQKDFGKTSIKLQKPLIEKHENYSTFMYKCNLKCGCEYTKVWMNTSEKVKKLDRKHL